MYTSDVGATRCWLCPPGYYSMGSSAKPWCNGCAPGTSSSATGATYCAVCAIGTYAPTPGLTACSKGSSSCPSGSEWKAGTATTDAICVACASGGNTNIYLYEPNVCAFKCIAGYQVSASATACVSCTPGQFKDNQLGSNTFCAQCTAGTYQSGSNASTCINCVAGTFVSAGSGMTASAGCEKCKRGMYAPTQASTQCLACSVGTYSTHYGSTMCLACAAGFTNGRGATYCYPVGSTTAFYDLQAPPSCQMVTDLQYAACNAI